MSNALGPAGLGHWTHRNSVHVHWICLISLEKENAHLLTSNYAPQRSSVELMVRELGAIAELQTAEMIMSTKNLTLGFDATTQEEMHINSIHFTSKTECLAAAVDELPGV